MPPLKQNKENEEQPGPFEGLMKVKQGKELLDEWTKKYKKDQRAMEEEPVKEIPIAPHQELVEDWFGEKRVRDKGEDSPDIPQRRRNFEYKEVVRAEKDDDCDSNWDEESFIASPKN